MVCYRLRKDDMFQKDIGSYSSYGIDAVDDSSDDPICSIWDISFDKEALERLVFHCNKLQLDVLHLEDVVEDFLAQYYTVSVVH